MKNVVEVKRIVRRIEIGRRCSCLREERGKQRERNEKQEIERWGEKWQGKIMEEKRGEEDRKKNVEGFREGARLKKGKGIER